VTLKGVSLQLECRRSFDGKVGGLIARRIKRFIPVRRRNESGFWWGLVNGGDALVVARELHFQGYEVVVYCPFPS